MERLKSKSFLTIIITLMVLLHSINIIADEGKSQKQVDDELEKLGGTFNGVPIEMVLEEYFALMDPEEVKIIKEMKKDEDKVVDGVIIEGPYRNANGETLNIDLYNKYGVIAFGDITMGKANDKNEPRYIGTNIYGENISNFLYPYDIDPPAGADFAKYNWLSNPSKNTKVTNPYGDVTTGFEDFIDNSQYVQQFREGMKRQHGNYYNDNNNVEWEKIFHVLTPPTKYSNGLARLWFTSVVDGSTRYIDVLLIAESILNGDASMRIYYNGKDVTNGSIEVSEKDKENVTVTVEVDASLSKAETITWSGGSLDGTLSVGTTSRTDTLTFGTTSRNYSAAFGHSDPNVTVADPVSAGVTIRLIEHKEEEIELILNYNELGKNYVVTIPTGTISFVHPNDFNAWVDPIAALYNVIGIDNGKLNEDLKIEPLYALGGVGTDSASVTPIATFTTLREHFGDDPENKSYSSNGQNDDKFDVTASGSETRRYEPDNFTPIIDTNTGEVTNYLSTSARFDPTLDLDIKITALIYNGSSYVPGISPPPTGEGVAHEEFARKIDWQGHSIPFKVSRDMIDADGNTVEVPGQYTR